MAHLLRKWPGSGFGKNVGLSTSVGVQIRVVRGPLKRRP